MLKETIMDIIDLTKIEVDFDNFSTEVVKINAMGFDAMAYAVRKFKHVTDWDEGRYISIYTDNGRFTLYYVNDCIATIYAEELPIEWYFANKRANTLSREELIELFIG